MYPASTSRVDKLIEKSKKILKESKKEINYYTFVRQLIQTDSYQAINALFQLGYNVYAMGLNKGEDSNNSFIKLCVRYNAVQSLKNVQSLMGIRTRRDNISQLVQKEKKSLLKNKSCWSLFGLIENDKIAVCDVLLSMGFEIKNKGWDIRNSLIYIHAKKQNHKMVRWLIYNGADLGKGVKNDNWLIEACCIGFWEVLPVLIPIFDLTDTQCYNDLLHVAVASGDITTVQILTKNGYNEQLRDGVGFTPIFYAVLFEDKIYSPILYRLLFNLNWNISVTDNHGNTLLHIAIIVNDIDRIKLILKYIEQNEYDKSLDILNVANQNGHAPLMLAIITENELNVRALCLTDKCNVDACLEFCVEQDLPKMFTVLGDFVADFQIGETYYQMMTEGGQKWEKVLQMMEQHELQEEEKKEEKIDDDDKKEEVVMIDNSEFIKDYRDDGKTVNNIDEDDVNKETDKNVQLLDLCLSIMDNDATSQFAEKYFDQVIMRYMFDPEWEILNNIAAASQYECILLKAYQHEEFKKNINSIICKHKKEKNAQLIVESLTFSYGNRYCDCKILKQEKKEEEKEEKKEEKENENEMVYKSVTMVETQNQAIQQKETNILLRECIEYIMKQTIYEKLETVQTKTLSQKLSKYINLNEIKLHKNTELEIKQSRNEEKSPGVLGKYQRMKRSGIRTDVVRDKMRADNLSAHTWDDITSFDEWCDSLDASAMKKGDKIMLFNGRSQFARYLWSEKLLHCIFLCATTDEESKYFARSALNIFCDGIIYDDGSCINVDENSLYCCFAKEIYGNVNQHLTVRNECCKYMNENAYYFGSKEKKEETESDAKIDIIALSEVYNVRVVVLEYDMVRKTRNISFQQGYHRWNIELPLITLIKEQGGSGSYYSITENDRKFDVDIIKEYIRDKDHIINRRYDRPLIQYKNKSLSTLTIREMRLREEARNVLHSVSYSLKNELEDEENLGGQLREQDIKTLLKAADDVIDWLKKDGNIDGDSKINDYKREKQVFEEIVQPILSNKHK